MEQSTEQDLRDVLTRREPLGPRATEDILNHPDAFRELYATKADLAGNLAPRRPAYVIGRKGAGKTAFLIGESLASGSDVVSIKAENAFAVMDALRHRWEQRRGSMPVDNLVFLWEAVLMHGAMRGALKLANRADATRIHQVSRYLQLIVAPEPPAGETPARPLDLREDQFLAAVGQRMSEAIDADEGISAVRDVVARLGAGELNYRAVRDVFTAMLARPERGRRLCIVVDNLEDLHMKVDGLEMVLAGLFRIVSRVTDPAEPIPLPFDLRFAFPAELIPRLRKITANPEKDFRNRLTIEWTAAELIDLAGRRLRTSLEVNFGHRTVNGVIPPSLPPEEVLRAFLPGLPFRNGLGQVEDPVGYIMRHTQLLPRHLIQILNEVTSPMFSDTRLRRVTDKELIRGVRAAEPTIVEGILSSYLYEYPDLRIALERLQNRVPFAFAESTLRTAYNTAGVKRISGQRFEEFLWAAVSAGVIGLQRTTTERYVVGDFSYTYSGSLRPMVDDELCIHPLFVHVLNDDRALDRLRRSEEKPVYPYGSGLEEAA